MTQPTLTPEQQMAVNREFPNPASIPLEEYCVFCEKPIWFLRAGDTRAVDRFAAPDTCNCEWDCCRSVQGHPHVKHHALRPRESGKYTLSEKQMDLLRDGHGDLLSNARGLDFVRMFPAFGHIDEARVVFAKNMHTGEDLIEVDFDENNVYNYTRAHPPFASSQSTSVDPKAIEFLQKLSDLNREVDNGLKEQVQDYHMLYGISYAVLRDCMRLMSRGQIKVKSSAGRMLADDIMALSDFLHDHPMRIEREEDEPDEDDLFEMLGLKRAENDD